MNPLIGLTLGGLPASLLTDSYKTTHPFLYPESQRMSAYGEFRQPYNKDKSDQRILFFGIRYIIETYIAVRHTVESVEQAAAFFATHNAGGTPFPFPKDLFLKFIKENDGYFPVTIKALPEGSIVYPHTPVYEVTAEGIYSRLVTYLETVLTMVWYPTTVATLSRRCKSILQETYDKTVDESGLWSLENRLHDFGFRGCTSVEQSIIGGVSHLVNFSGTDTLSAAFYAQYHLNNGKPVGFSIPATEHSIMTSYPNEKLALEHLLNEYGSGVCACVMDSYDYTHALESVLPSVAKLKVAKGGYLVLRPDSGEPVSVVVQALKAADKIFGSEMNSKGYKVLRGIGVIQGDGINISTLQDIVIAVEKEGYSAQNVAYGMGGGLLQKVHRDTMSFATKLSKIIYQDGSERNVMKMPKGDVSKRSLPGEFAVFRSGDEPPMVYPIEDSAQATGINELQLVYNKGKLPIWDDFTAVRNRASRQWTLAPKVHQVISKELEDKVVHVMALQNLANTKV